MNIYVGNVDFKATENQLSDLFAEYGEVTSVKIISDKLTGRSKGYAFVEMANDGEAKAAVEALNGYLLNSREISVSVARPREENKNFSRGRDDNRGYNRRY
ncbi:MAG: RNA-binding protein [Bacteroidales bacterium]|nr:RNA-binding protein [Bacteroidales bacterium]MDZ4203447.1 RNA-binding protein [Bacteroidales bacterium]